MGIAAILITEAWAFKQMFKSPLTGGSTWNLVKTGPGSDFRENTFKSTYAKGQNLQKNNLTWLYPFTNSNHW